METVAFPHRTGLPAREPGHPSAVTRAAIRILGGPLRDASAASQVADAAVVLGAPLTAAGGLTPVLEERVRAGVAAWASGAAPLVCVTGGGPPGRVEADPMAARARELGVPAEAIRVERRARNTEENARFAAEVLLPEACRRVWVITQPFHLRRARRLFELAGFDARAWYIRESLEYRHRAAIRWIAREYAAWARSLGRRALSPRAGARAELGPRERVGARDRR